MKTTTIYFKTLTPLRNAIASSDGLVDNDILTDNEGFPYINRERITGLFRESMLMVLERLGYSDNNIEKFILSIYGNEGAVMGNKKRIRFGHATVKDIKQDIKTWVRQNSFQQATKEFYSTIIQQTKIDPDTQSALKGSLRTLRATKDGLDFALNVDYDESIEWLFQLAQIELNRIGAGRNRGMGAIQFEGMEELNLENLFDELPDDLNILKYSGSNAVHHSKDSNGSQENSSHNYNLKITLLERCAIPTLSDNENTINTLSYIPGRNIWGLMAGEYLAIKKTADELFNKIFYSGAVQFCPATIKGASIIPRNIQLSKAAIDSFVDKFDPEITDKSSYLDAYSIKGHLTKVVREISLRTSRNKHRIAGSSTDGELFYTESISSGQEFICKIKGASASALIGLVFGKDKSIQSYLGHKKQRVRLEYDKIENDNQKNTSEAKIKECVFCFTQPAIIINEYGFAEPSIDNIKRELESSGLKVSAIEAVAQYHMVQHIKRIWKTKESSYPAYAQGSAFKVILENDIQGSEMDAILENGLGLLCNQGFGIARRWTEGLSEENWYSDNENFVVNDEIKSTNLYRFIQQQESLAKIRMKALNFKLSATSYKNNHLRRLQELFDECDSAKEVDEYLDNSKNKKKKFVVLLNEKLGWKKMKTEYPVYQDLKSYYLSLFKSLKANARNK